MTQNRNSAYARFVNIMNSRNVVNFAHAQSGTPFRCQIQGNPKLGYIDERLADLNTGEAGVAKDLYSFNVYKEPVTDTKAFTEGVKALFAARGEDETEEQKALVNDLLNMCQLSFGIINRDGRKPRFVANQVVDLILEVTKVQDRDANGNRLETTHDAIIVKSMAPVAAVVASKGKRWGADISEELPVPDPSKVIAESIKA